MGIMKMYYRKWTESDLKGLFSIDGMVAFYTESDDSGHVRREIGINAENKVVHKCPSDSYKHGTYGLFDNQRVGFTDKTIFITKEEFENLWNKSNK